jgi:hypothetical protein
VLRKDRSVCGTDNLVAFAKLQRLLVMYFAMRQKLGERLGEVQAAAIERYVVDRLRCAFPDLGSSWPP